MRKLSVSVCCLLFLLPLAGSAQQLLFDQFVKNKKIGTLTAVKETDGATTTYRIESIVKTRVIMTIDIQFYLESTFRDGILQSSEVKVFRNGKLKEHCVTRQEDSRYLVTNDGQSSWLEVAEIRFTAAKLYFEEPGDRSTVYSEQFGLFNPIASYRENGYRMDPEQKSQDNYFHYLDGRLESAELGHWLASIHLKACTGNGEESLVSDK